MKIRVILGLILLASNFTFAQKLTKENFKKYEFEVPPEEMTFQEFEKYTVSARCLWDDASVINQVLLASKLRGFEKTTNKAEADFSMNYIVRSISFSSPSYTTKKTTKEKDGVKTVTVHHNYRGTCSYNVEVNIYGSNGEMLYSDVEIGTITINESSSTGKSDAYTRYKNTKKRHRSSVTGKAVRKIENRFADKFCYVPYRVSFKGVKVKPKKYDYDEFNNAVDGIKVSLNRSSVNARLEFLEPAIEAWKNDLKEADEISKKARVNTKVISAAYYNIGVANFLLNRFEEAKENFKKAYNFNKMVVNNLKHLIHVSEQMNERKDNIRVDEE